MRLTRAAPGQRILVPEVVQSSAMDCGPASLKCLLDGFGVRVSYGRLREACQTDVDGTSIDTLEEVALQLGLEAEQVMIPPDHLLLPEAEALPALSVISLPNGSTHFVVLWGTVGPLVQVMDPGTGRRWPTRQGLLGELYKHRMPVPAEGWREWAGSDEFLLPLASRLRQVGIRADRAEGLLERASQDDSWATLATVDAGARMVESLCRGGGMRRGSVASRFLDATLTKATAPEVDGFKVIPPTYWSVSPMSEDPDSVRLKGAVLVRVLGVDRSRLRVRGEAGASPRRAGDEGDPRTEPREPAEAPAGSPPDPDHDPDLPPLSPDLVAALDEPPARPGRELWRMLRADGVLVPGLLTGALLVSAVGVVFEALLLRGMMEMGRELGLQEQRLGAMAAVLLFMLLMLGLELPIAGVVLRLGRRLEARLRVAFMEKIPRLGDRYFHSRLTSDMAERSHSVHAIRALPQLGADLLRATFGLVLTTTAIALLSPDGAGPALAVAALSVVLPLLLQPLLAEKDLRVRTHGGALSRFYLDALLGLVPIRTHGAERSVRREHESLLAEWARAGLSLLRAAALVEGALALAGAAMACWLLFNYLGTSGEVEGVLLLVYWALRIPALGGEVAMVARQYPSQRNITLRLMEPLGAPEEGRGVDSGAAATGAPGEGAAVSLAGVGVRISGHTILEEVDLEVPAGEQLAIVGPSGAGKSSLVGLLLGWHTPSEGRLEVDGRSLEGAALEGLRRRTAWVDPSVQLWNRSFLHNLRYGNRVEGLGPLAQVMESADLRPVLEKLPDGLQTPLGEGGGLVSGGEGQRVRLGRAMLREETSLVILDEPFRGLDRGQRRRLLGRVRAWWPGATLLCITHDVGETLAFERVVVVEGGRVVEDGEPAQLARREGSRYAALLAGEEKVRRGLWSGAAWRQVMLEGGQTREEGP